MKHIRFIHGVGIALVLGFFGSAMFISLAPVWGTAVIIKLLIAVLGLVYIGFLLSRSEERLGRLTAIAVWLSSAVLAWYFAPTLFTYTLVHLGSLWILRSLYFYSSAFSALLDLGLTSLAVCAALWAAQVTGSVFLTIWCFFLVQALFPVIPVSMRRPKRSRQRDKDQRFSRAYRSAEAAVRRISA
jgi:hypothetical protein